MSRRRTSVNLDRAIGRRRWLASTLLCLALWQPACAVTPRLTKGDTAPIDQLLSLVVERLEVAPTVAQTKWTTKALIEDPLREAQIVTSVGESAARAGVARGVAEQFFRAQIEASKVVQRELFAQYEARQQPPFPAAADLNTAVRPTLDRLTPKMLIALGRASPVLAQPGGRAALQERARRLVLPQGVSRNALGVALAPFR